MADEVQGAGEHRAEAEAAPERRHAAEPERQPDVVLAHVHGAPDADEHRDHPDRRADGDGAKDPRGVLVGWMVHI